MSLKKNTVLIGLSGGVDSSVAAFILKEKGYEVHGIHFILTDSKSSDENLEITKKISKQLDIPLIVLDIRKDFEKTVIKYFIESYKDGLTPNPCVICNPYIKFKYSILEAKNRGISFVATGHYARIQKQNNRYMLTKALYLEKDQSYFLALLPKDYLKWIIFPLGEFSKSKVVEIAKEIGVYENVLPESQEVCFLKGDYREFLLERCPFLMKEGEIVDINGRVLGRHLGLFRYTIGQRRGLGIPDKTPYYVVSLDVKSNRLVVGKSEHLFSKKFIVDRLNWLDKEMAFNGSGVKVKIRFRHKGSKAIIKEINKDKILVEFLEPQRAITPGQFAVFYLNDQVLGGGRICELPSIHWAVK